MEVDKTALYDMIFKRRTFRKFDRSLSLSEKELVEIQSTILKVEPLLKTIEVRMRIVNRNQTTAKRGQYCLLLYSEEKPFYLVNAGYILEQIDLLMASCHIGVCWYGVAKPKEMHFEGLNYVIMLAIGKCKPEDFRKNISEFRRKPVNDIWEGHFIPELAGVIRLAPSGCNLQPWRITCSGKEIKVYKQSTMKSFPEKKRILYEQTDYSCIDIGICLCFLEISLLYNGYCFKRVLNHNTGPHEEGLEIASYEIDKTLF